MSNRRKEYKMSQIKKLSVIAVLGIAGLLLLSSPAFAHGGNNRGHCGQFTINTSQLSKEQAKKIDGIQDQYNEKTIPLRQKLNLLRTETYNYNLNKNIDIDKVKDYRQQIRDIQGKIDDTRLDEIAELNKVLPEDQQISFNGYFGQYADNVGSGMMNNCGMMNNMMGNGMYGMMYGNSYGNMMGGWGNMMHGNDNGNGMMHYNGNDQ